MKVWKSVVGYPKYEISEDGQLRRGTRLLTVQINKGGYRKFGFPWSGKKKFFTAGRLVLDAFVGPRPFLGAEVCHCDGNRQNDHWSNLRWDTHAANIADKRIHGTWQNGEKHGRAKLNVAEVVEIRARISAGESQLDLSEEFGVSTSLIQQIWKRKIWREVA